MSLGHLWFWKWLFGEFKSWIDHQKLAVNQQKWEKSQKNYCISQGFGFTHRSPRKTGQVFTRETTGHS